MQMSRQICLQFQADLGWALGEQQFYRILLTKLI